MTFSGIKIRSYEKRILTSKSEQIVLVPVENRKSEDSNKERISTMNFVSSLIDDNTNDKNSCLVSVYKGLVADILERVFQRQVCFL